MLYQNLYSDCKLKCLLQKCLLFGFPFSFIGMIHGVSNTKQLCPVKENLDVNVVKSIHYGTNCKSPNLANADKHYNDGVFFFT